MPACCDCGAVRREPPRAAAAQRLATQYAACGVHGSRALPVLLAARVVIEDTGSVVPNTTVVGTHRTDIRQLCSPVPGALSGLVPEQCGRRLCHDLAGADPGRACGVQLFALPVSWEPRALDHISVYPAVPRRGGRHPTLHPVDEFEADQYVRVADRHVPGVRTARLDLAADRFLQRCAG